MNRRVLIAFVCGVAALVLLFVFPPWKAHGIYSGHIRLDQVAWMDFDVRRYRIEQGVIVLVTALVCAVFWTRHPDETDVSEPMAPDRER